MSNTPNSLRQRVAGGLLLIGLGAAASGAVMSAERSDAAAGVTVTGDIAGVDASASSCHNQLNPLENTVSVRNNRAVTLLGSLTVDPANAPPESAGNFTLQPGVRGDFTFLISQTEDGSVTVSADGENATETVSFNCDADATTTTTSMIETTPSTFTIVEPQPGTAAPVNSDVTTTIQPSSLEANAGITTTLPTMSVAKAQPTTSPSYTG